MIQELEHYLAQGLEQFSMQTLSAPLAAYVRLLHKWNGAYNLTAIRSLEDMVNKHILDSLAITPWLKGHRIIDVGTGPGLPGIPLALANPDRSFVLLDSNGKKTRFLHEVQRSLDLTNIEIVSLRAEQYRPNQGFDTITSRAFSSLEQMMHWTQHLIAEEGIWLAMKGLRPEAELGALEKTYRVEDYTVQGIEGARCCVIINNNN